MRTHIGMGGLLVGLGLALTATAAGAAERFSWRETPAEVLPNGDLKWKPTPYAFEKGASVRYIDFEKGDDANAGDSKEKPWKRHPWDPEAAGNAKACTGIHTYVFKGGVVYRGRLAAKESGKAGDPIRLTRDPAWGDGPAVISGAERVTGWKQGETNALIPDGGKVWHADLDYAPRNLWLFEGGKIVRLALARTPNWTESNPDDVKSEWWTWEQPNWWEGKNKTTVNGKKIHLGVDTKRFTQGEDYYKDAIVRSEWGIVMGTPYPAKVEAFDAAKKGVAFSGYWFGDSGTVITNNRYFLEDKPQYLDAPGEFWFEKKGAGGRLFLRLPNDADPNAAVIEAGKRYCLLEDAASAGAPPRTDVLKPEQRDGLDLTGMKHVTVSGLAFQCTNTWWDLEYPAWMHKEVDNAAIRMRGSSDAVRIDHCSFAFVGTAVLASGITDKAELGALEISDCEIRETESSAINLRKPSDARVLRNYMFRVGVRPYRQSHGHALCVNFPDAAEVAGNILDRIYGAGLFIFGGKGSGQGGDAPFCRLLIHHNKVTDPLLNTNDWGGIETWQGGPAYVYNNVSGNPGGYWHWGYNKAKPGGARFGHAYYLDGAFKNYHFNNIAWGKSSDPASPLCNSSAFQEIHSYQNTFFNNTVYNFYQGSRRQAPHAGRNAFLGNVFQSVSGWVFWHSQPAKSAAEGNAKDAGAQKEHYDFTTNAYANNVFQDISGQMGCYEPSGRWLKTLDEFKAALAEHRSLASSAGVDAPAAPLRDAAKGDFRLAPGSAAIDQGVKVFVPWALSGVVGEWNFRRNQADAGVLIDDHWYMTAYFAGREDYYARPMYPLKAANVKPEDYVPGPLEDWTEGALKLNGKDQYAALAHAELSKPFEYTPKKGQAASVSGADLRNPDVTTSNFSVELYVKVEPGAQGILLRKMDDAAGYALTVDAAGLPVFAVKAGGTTTEAKGAAKLADGAWHHVFAEADRAAKRLTLYVDGKKAGESAGPGADVSLANGADLCLGGSAQGSCLAATFEFARLSLGTLADARTTIEELYAWEFDGPFLRDFAGRAPEGKRDAGALEFAK
ncbi:MAG: LamG domain-containing protein [Planctomycetota bacterium]|nr:LamG domain-containing protein [Planctomycetota bacterium]